MRACLCVCVCLFMCVCACDRLFRKIRILEAETTALNVKISEHDRANRSQKDQTEKALENLEQQKRDTVREKGEMEEEHRRKTQKVQKELDTTHASLSTAKKQIVDLEEEGYNETKRADALQTRLTATEKARDKAETHNAKLTEQQKTLSKELEEQRKQLKGQEDKQETLQAALATHTEEVADARRESEQLRRKNLAFREDFPVKLKRMSELMANFVNEYNEVADGVGALGSLVDSQRFERETGGGWKREAEGGWRGNNEGGVDSAGATRANGVGGKARGKPNATKPNTCRLEQSAGGAAGRGGGDVAGDGADTQVDVEQDSYMQDSYGMGPNQLGAESQQEQQQEKEEKRKKKEDKDSKEHKAEIDSDGCEITKVEPHSEMGAANRRVKVEKHKSAPTLSASQSDYKDHEPSAGVGHAGRTVSGCTIGEGIGRKRGMTDARQASQGGRMGSTTTAATAAEARAKGSRGDTTEELLESAD